MQEKIKKLLDQFKLLCGDEAPEEAWFACISISNVPDANALLDIFSDVMEQATDQEMSEIAEYMEGAEDDTD